MTDKTPPGSEVLIKSLTAKRLDESRIRASIQLSNPLAITKVVLSLSDADEIELAKTVIMGAVGFLIDFTLHIRRHTPRLPIQLTCTLYKDEDSELDRESIEV